MQIETMMQKYERLVYTVCYQLTRNHHTAQDLCQDTFLSAYTHISSCPQGNEKAWLVRIASNKAKDHLKSAYNRKVGLPGPETVGEAAEQKPDMAPTPEEYTIDKEQQNYICHQIQSLKEPYRKVATLFFLQQFSVVETANLLGRPQKTVQTQVYRAKKQLRVKLAAQMVAS